MYAPELETLDQLLGGDMPLTVIAKLYSSPEAFRTGIRGLLSCVDVLLLDTEGNGVPTWRWRVRPQFCGTPGEVSVARDATGCEKGQLESGS